MAEAEEVIASLKATLEMKENECEKLKEENAMLKKGMTEMEDRMKVAIRKCEERMEAKMSDVIKDLVGIDGAHGGGKTSTPLFALDELLKPEQNGESGKMNEGDGGAKKKKTSKNRRHERKLKARLGKSTDSLYSSVCGDGEKNKDGTEESSSENEDVDVFKSLVIREVPRIGKFALYGSEDIEDFFKKYESYCRRKVGEDER